MVRDNRFISVSCLSVEIIRWFGRRFSVWGILNMLLDACYLSRRPTRFPDWHCHGWGRIHRRWDLRRWRYWGFRDKSRFMLFQSGGRSHVHCRQGERLIISGIQPAASNRGPSVIAWGAIHHGGRGELVVLDRTFNCQCYTRLLRDSMLPQAKGVFGRNFACVQNNDMSHTTSDTAAFLAQQYLEVRDWPSQSPDMSLVEHVWDRMEVWIQDMDDPLPFCHNCGMLSSRRWLQFASEGRGP